MTSLQELEGRRERECRLTPEVALETLDEAEDFLRDRGLLTLMPDSALPSLFGACHEEPYKRGSRGFGLWPKTKYPWGIMLQARPGVCFPRLHAGKGLFMTIEIASLADPLCRAELARADAGELGEDATRLLAHLQAAGPSLLDDVKTELGLEPKALRSLRARLERIGALVPREVRLELPDGGHEHTTELSRWDQIVPEPTAGGLDELIVAGVRAAVVARIDEPRRWFSWRADPGRLVAEGRLAEPEPGWICLP
ncbi:MAG: hypothetical protein WBB74_08650 [Gaiellaceae bacterium]